MQGCAEPGTIEVVAGDWRWVLLVVGVADGAEPGALPLLHPCNTSTKSYRLPGRVRPSFRGATNCPEFGGGVVVVKDRCTNHRIPLVSGAPIVRPSERHAAAAVPQRWPTTGGVRRHRRRPPPPHQLRRRRRRQMLSEGDDGEAAR